MDYDSLQKTCRSMRRNILKMIAGAASGHPGGSLSCVELVAATYLTQMKVDAQNPHMPSRDRFVLSKGHAAPCQYAMLGELGFFDKKEFDSFRQLHSMLQGHPDSQKVPGVDVSTGSLGQGISLAVGMALGAKLGGEGVRVYAVIGDGELQEGQVWEALTAAAHYKLDNLTVMLDYNGLQIDGSNNQVMGLGDVHGRFAADGLHVVEVKDGNDIQSVVEALDAPTAPGKPKLIMAHTVKGKGVSFMENQVGWHGKAPNAQELEAALKELEDRA